MEPEIRGLLIALGLIGAAGGGFLIWRYLQRPACSVRRVRFFTEGANPDWFNDKISFDRVASLAKPPGADNFFNIYTIGPDGSNLTCLTDNPSAPLGHKGMPSFSADGKWIAFIAENELGRHGWYEQPGKGQHNDLWIMSSDGNSYYRMTDLTPLDTDGATLCPHFSPDGRQLTWSEMHRKSRWDPNLAYFYGSWKLKIADFSVVGGQPVLSNVREFIPGDDVFYENHGISPDGRKWIFTSNFRGDVSVGNCKIYTYDFQTEEIKVLAGDIYNEHARYSPTGGKIAWMHGPGIIGLESDLWIMNSDGKNKKRLTFFNEPYHPHNLGEPVLVCVITWCPLGDKVMFMLTGGTAEGKQWQKLYLLEFEGRCG